MSWARSRPGGRGYVNPKYRTPEYLATRDSLMNALKQAGQGTCAEVICVMPTRMIHAGMPLHLCHDRKTGQILGLGHARCNKSEAGRHARATQSSTPLRW